MKMASSISGELWHRLVTRATTKVAGPEPSKGSRSRLDIDSPNFRRLAYSPTCLEEEFSEVRGYKAHVASPHRLRIGAPGTLPMSNSARGGYMGSEDLLRAVATCYSQTSREF